MPIEPEDFRGKPLYYGGNFSGHLWIAIQVTFWVCIGWYFVMGEIPYKAFLMTVLVIVYLSLELPQKGKLFDSFGDIWIVLAYGGAGVLISFSEMQPGSSLVVLDLKTLLPFMAVATIHQVAGMAWREWQRRKDNV